MGDHNVNQTGQNWSKQPSKKKEKNWPVKKREKKKKKTKFTTKKKQRQNKIEQNTNYNHDDDDDDEISALDFWNFDNGGVLLIIFERDEASRPCLFWFLVEREGVVEKANYSLL